MNTEAIKTLRDALTRLRNECDLSGLRDRAGFDHWLNVADEALAATVSIENPERVALSDAALNRMWLELTDEHVISKAAFFAVYRAILATQADAPKHATLPEVPMCTKSQTLPPLTQYLIAEAARDDVAKNRQLSSPDVIAAIAASTKEASEWTPITAPGQVKVGTRLRFTIGDEKFSETAKQILHPGTGEEEIIYNKRKNYYLITSMAIKNRGSQKNVEFLAAIAASKEAP